MMVGIVQEVVANFRIETPTYLVETDEQMNKLYLRTQPKQEVDLKLNCFEMISPCFRKRS
jgi:glucose-6-phosphate 1-dehydrogenase